MSLKLIWAEDKWGGIGVNNSLPWHLKEDLKFFKKQTENQPVLMGYKTWLSLPFKPLPNRTNIILSRTADIPDEGNSVIVMRNLQDAIDSFPNSWIIGGGTLYKESLAYAEELYITEVDTEIENPDVFAPDRNIIDSLFTRVYRSEKKFDFSSGLSFTFNTYVRNHIV